MEQSFELNLEAEWNNKTSKAEKGKEFKSKIAKTLGVFNKIKAISQKIANSPVTNGKVTVEVKAPVIAVSAQWSLDKTEGSKEIITALEFGIETKPFIEIEAKINLWKIFREYGPNAVIPGAGLIINFVLEKLESNVGISFIVSFSGSINIKGQIKGNTESIKNTSGTIEVEGKIQVTVEFKAWANADLGYAGFEGYIKANVNSAISAGFISEISKEGLCGYPTAKFDGVIAKYVAVGTVKFGIFKRTFTKEGKYVIVEPSAAKFDKHYLIGPYK